MIRKTVVLGIIVILLLVVAGPVFLGFTLDKYHDQYAQQISQQGIFEVKQTRFSRGLLVSHSEIMLDVPPRLCRREPCPQLVLESEIHHGPLPFGAFNKINEPLKFVRGVIITRLELEPLLGSAQVEPPLPGFDAHTEVHLSGQSLTKLKLKGGHYRFTDTQLASSMDMRDLVGKFITEPETGKVHGGFILPTLTIKQADGLSSAIKGVEIRMDGKPGEIFTGAVNVQADEITGAGTNLKNLRLEYLSRLEGGSLDTRLALNVNTMTIPPETIGPILIEAESLNMNRRALLAVQNRIEELSDTVPPEMLPALITQVYAEHLPELMRSDPELNINRIFISTGQGDINGRLKLKLSDDYEPEPGHGTDRVLKELTGEAYLQLPDPMVRRMIENRLVRKAYRDRQAGTDGKAADISTEDVDNSLQALIEEGWLDPRPEENAYAIFITLNDGKMLINGYDNPYWSLITAVLTGTEPKSQSAEPVLPE